MNTESFQNQTVLITTGERLRQARESMGFSQQSVAKKLCLKVSTVQDIEKDYINPNLALTFLRGYIRSYARLVHISDEELMQIMEKQDLIKTSQVMPMQNFSLSKTRKKHDNWLMGCTWLILFVVIGLTGAWWWQHYKVQQQDIISMSNQSSTDLLEKNNVSSMITDNSHENVSTVIENTQIDESVVGVNGDTISDLEASAPSKTSVINVNTSLVINFTDNCWLEVFDVSGKKLFSGIQHNGDKLNLIGQAPYKLKIGAPAAVQIQYQGKPVDLSRFIKSNQVAHLVITAQ